MIDVTNSRVSKRTLTKKSKWEFSRNYRGYTVEQIMEIHPITLYWGYTHLEKIDFNDEVLEFLKGKRVNKIPISPEVFDAYKKARSKRITVLSKKDRLSKEFLQRKNQGHKL